MHVAKLEDAGQGALLKLCVKKFFIEMAIIPHFSSSKIFMAVKMTFKVEISLF